MYTQLDQRRKLLGLQQKLKVILQYNVQAKLGEVADLPALALFGGSDEYMPPSETAEGLRNKMAAVLTHPLSQTRVIEGADHALDGYEKEAVTAMIEFVKSVS